VAPAAIAAAAAAAETTELDLPPAALAVAALVLVLLAVTASNKYGRTAPAGGVEGGLGDSAIRDGGSGNCRR
jgi:hypothetical protein